MEENKTPLENVPNGKFKVKELVDYQGGGVVSRTLVDRESGTLTVFAFDKEQSLSEHSAPYDAFVQVLDGKGLIIIDGKEHELQEGETIVMPADIPHAVQAHEKFKMLLTMVR